jgi:hypothetical protein
VVEHRVRQRLDSLGSKHVRSDQLVKRHQDDGTGPDMIGHGRDRELNPLARILFTLPIERLVIGVSTSIMARRHTAHQHEIAALITYPFHPRWRETVRIMRRFVFRGVAII